MASVHRLKIRFLPKNINSFGYSVNREFAADDLYEIVRKYFWGERWLDGNVNPKLFYLKDLVYIFILLLTAGLHNPSSQCDFANEQNTTCL